MMKSEFLTGNDVTVLYCYSFKIIFQPWLVQIPWLILHIQLNIDQIVKTFVISNKATSVVQDITRKNQGNGKALEQGCIKVLMLCKKEKKHAISKNSKTMTWWPMATAIWRVSASKYLCNILILPLEEVVQPWWITLPWIFIILQIMSCFIISVSHVQIKSSQIFMFQFVYYTCCSHSSAFSRVRCQNIYQ